MVGWIATSAYRAPILVFWLFELPPIWREDKAFSEMMFTRAPDHRDRDCAPALRPYRRGAVSPFRPQGRRADAHGQRLDHGGTAASRIDRRPHVPGGRRRRCARARSCACRWDRWSSTARICRSTPTPCWPRRSPGRIVERWGEAYDLWRLPSICGRAVARARLGGGDVVAVGQRHDGDAARSLPRDRPRAAGAQSSDRQRSRRQSRHPGGARARIARRLRPQSSARCILAR